MILDATFTECNHSINADFEVVEIVKEVVSDLPMWEGGSY